MILLAAETLTVLVDAAEAAYPRESCGLLVGRTSETGTIRVSRAVVSENVAEGGGTDRFEVDPRLRLRLMKELRGGPERIVGHFHSHPDHPAQPSATDLDLAFESDMAWLITAVHAGQAIHTTAHVLDESARQFREIPMRTDDWEPYPSRPALFPDSETPE